jgi:hypothetical protein
MNDKFYRIPVSPGQYLFYLIVLSCIPWACHALWMSLSDLIELLQIVFNFIARWIIGLLRNSFILFLFKSANVPPLKAYLNYTSQIYIIRIVFLQPDYLPTKHIKEAGFYLLRNFS